MFSVTFWYARLDSNQWPTESESSGGQTGNRWAPVILWVLGRFTKFDRKSPEALQLNASGDFYGSSQIVVKQHADYFTKSNLKTKSLLNVHQNIQLLRNSHY